MAQWHNTSTTLKSYMALAGTGIPYNYNLSAGSRTKPNKLYKSNRENTWQLKTGKGIDSKQHELSNRSKAKSGDHECNMHANMENKLNVLNSLGMYASR